MADAQVYDAVKEFFQKIFGDPAVAAQVAADPQGALAAYGINDYEDLDFREAVAETYGGYELPYGSHEALEGYAAGAPAPANYPVQAPPAYSGGYQAPAEAVAHVQYVTYAAYENHPEITQEIVNTQQLLFVDESTNVDNSTDVAIDVAGDLDGDVTVAPENATALGEQSVANTGDGNLINTGDGDLTNVEDVEGPVLVDSDVEGDGNVFGDNEGLVIGGDVEDAALANNGDAFAATGDGSVAGEEVIANTGSGDQLLALDGSELNANTGDGDQFVADEGSNLVAATGEDSVAIGEDNFGNVVTGEVGDGSVLAGNNVEGPVNTGELEGAQIDAGDNSVIEAQVQTGDGFLAGGDVSETVVGDENQTANLDLSTGSADGGTGGDSIGGTGGDGTGGAGGSQTGGAGGDGTGGGGNASAGGNAGGGASGSIDDLTLNFGDGNLTDSDVSDSAVSANGDAENTQVQDSFDVEESFNTEENDQSFNNIEGLGELATPLPEASANEADALASGEEIVAG